MKQVNIHEAKTHLSRILNEIEAGETYIISRNGSPVAELRKITAKPRSETDPILSKIQIRYDPIEPLSKEEWGEIE